MVYRILLEIRFIGFETRYRSIRLTPKLNPLGIKPFFFLVFPFDLNMNAALSCKRFGCASSSQFKHVVFKIHHVRFSISKSGILVYRIFLEKGFLLLGALVEDMLVFSLDSLEKLISYSSIRDSCDVGFWHETYCGIHRLGNEFFYGIPVHSLAYISRVFSHPHEERNMQISERVKFRRYSTLLIKSFVFLHRIIPCKIQ